MLDRLRPLVLEQMGLRHAIGELVASWRVRYPQIKWSLDLRDDFREPSEELALALYRLVQESVTNAIRHARGSAIEICLDRWAPGEANQGIRLSVRDDGAGLPDGIRYGFGLLGMTERVRQLGGTLSIINAHPTGVIVEALIPTEDVKGAPIHADPAA
jgi:two-component system sensor histidine kinase UhpB